MNGVDQPALVFDCDGVLADTERYGHLPAFNQTFQEFGLPVHWTEERYGELLAVGGGKERMRTLFADTEVVRSAGLPTDPERQDQLLRAWHRRKTALFTETLAAGRVPPRPGVRRVIAAALEAGWTLAVASTSAEASVRSVLEHAVGADLAPGFGHVLAGDVVPKKKPAPDIYQAVRERLGLPADQLLVIEDSGIGSTSAYAAGLPCVVTVSDYTRGDRFAPSPLVVSSLGDPDGERAEVLTSGIGALSDGVVTLDHLDDCLTWTGPE